MSAVTSKFYKNQTSGDKTNKSMESSSAVTEKEGTGSIASGKTTATYSTTSSNVSQHSEEPPDHEDEIEEGEWGEMEVRKQNSKIN